MKKILIAGSNGNIGSYIFNNLSDKYNVTGISKSDNKKHLQFFKLDLSLEDDVVLFAKNTIRFDVMIFFVALAHFKGKNKNYPQFYKVNVLTLKNLIKALEKQRKLPKQSSHAEFPKKDPKQSSKNKVPKQCSQGKPTESLS